MTINFWLACFTSIAFFYYGLMCLFSNKMVQEFIRFGLTNQNRIITGVLQLLGAYGIIVGLFLPLAGVVATFGLSIMMSLGFVIRIKVKDRIKASIPSFAFMIVNAYLFYEFYLGFYIR